MKKVFITSGLGLTPPDTEMVSDESLHNPLSRLSQMPSFRVSVYPACRHDKT